MVDDSPTVVLRSYWLPTKFAGERLVWMSVEFSLNRTAKKGQPSITEMALSSGSDEALLALPSTVSAKIRKEAQRLLQPWPEGRYADAYRRSGGILNMFTPPWGEPQDEVWTKMVAGWQSEDFPDDLARAEELRTLEKQWNTTPHPFFAGLTPAQVMVGGGPEEADLADEFLQRLTRLYDGHPFDGEGQALIKTLTLLRRWQSQPRKDGRTVLDIVVTERNQLLTRRARVLKRKLGSSTYRFGCDAACSTRQQLAPGKRVSPSCYDSEDIPSIADQAQRIEAVLIDCYGQAEELAAFEVYFTDAMQFPFSATWHDPDESEHAERIRVLAVDSVDERRGVLLSVERLQRGKKRRRLLAEQVWADEECSANAAILSDYRYWVNELNGLTPGFG